MNCLHLPFFEQGLLGRFYSPLFNFVFFPPLSFFSISLRLALLLVHLRFCLSFEGKKKQDQLLSRTCGLLSIIFCGWQWPVDSTCPAELLSAGAVRDSTEALAPAWPAGHGQLPRLQGVRATQLPLFSIFLWFPLLRFVFCTNRKWSAGLYCTVYKQNVFLMKYENWREH